MKPAPPVITYRAFVMEKSNQSGRAITRVSGILRSEERVSLSRHRRVSLTPQFTEFPPSLAKTRKSYHADLPRSIDNPKRALCRMNPHRRRCGRSEFVTTETLESAIAPAAIAGISHPSAAIGISARL